MPLNESDIAHLLSRTEFVASTAKIAELINLPSREAAVDAIIARNLNAPRTTIIGQTVGTTTFGVTLTKNEESVDNLRKWWLDQMTFGTAPLREKMTMFWHGHFTGDSDSENVDLVNQANQNQLYRDNALGDLRSFAYKMSIEPMMLKFLNNNENTSTKLNENFGRELLELFLLGLNNYGLIANQQFPYTEDDVFSCAQAWTGHGLTPESANSAVKYQYTPALHNSIPSTFLGKTQAWTAQQTIDHIFDTEPYRTISCRFIAEKLWSFLAYPNPEKAVLNNITLTFNKTLNITDLLRAILVHPNFYSPHAKTGLVSTPAEYVVRLISALGIRATQPELSKVVSLMPGTGQQLLRPPNVAGWKPNEYWMSTSQLGARGNIGHHLASTTTALNLFLDLDLDKGDIGQLVDIICRRLGVVSLLPASRFNIGLWLYYERQRRGSTKQFKSQGLFHLVTMSPDFNTL